MTKELTMWMDDKTKVILLRWRQRKHLQNRCKAVLERYFFRKGFKPSPLNNIHVKLNARTHKQLISPPPPNTKYLKLYGNIFCRTTSESVHFTMIRSGGGEYMTPVPPCLRSYPAVDFDRPQTSHKSYINQMRYYECWREENIYHYRYGPLSNIHV